MEFQIGQKVRLKPEFENDFKEKFIKYSKEEFEIEFVYKTYIKCFYKEGTEIFAKEYLYLVDYLTIEKERLEAAFYEYFDNIYSDPIEKHELVRKSVEELMNVVKSVSINGKL
jgi:hypothetical protein